MPGREAPVAEHAAAMAAHGITHILCLTSAAEIAQKSPDYAAAGGMGLAVHAHPIADFGTPDDMAAFTGWVRDQAALVRAGCVPAPRPSGIARRVSAARAWWGYACCGRWGMKTRRG